MIVQALFDFFTAQVNAVLALLPDAPIIDVSGYRTAAGPVFAWISWADWYFPAYQAIGIAGIALAGWAVFYLIDFALFVATKAHILGGST